MVTNHIRLLPDHEYETHVKSADFANLIINWNKVMADFSIIYLPSESNQQISGLTAKNG